MNSADLMRFGLSDGRVRRCGSWNLSTLVCVTVTPIGSSVSLEFRFSNSSCKGPTCRFLSHLPVTDHFFLRLDKSKNRKHPDPSISDFILTCRLSKLIIFLERYPRDIFILLISKHPIKKSRKNRSTRPFVTRENPSVDC